MGVRRLRCILSEFQHGYNMKSFWRCIIGYPHLGHFDTWLFELIQSLNAMNHSIIFCPNWSNGSEMKIRSGHNGVVSLHTKELSKAINAKGNLLQNEENSQNKPMKQQFENNFFIQPTISCKDARKFVTLPVIQGQ